MDASRSDVGIPFVLRQLKRRYATQDLSESVSVG